MVLLRPTDNAAAADVDDDEGLHYERIGVLDRPEPVCVPEASIDLRALRREQARRRCSMLLRCLGGIAVTTGIIGLWPGMHLAWIFTGLTGLTALGLVALMAYANELQEQQRVRRSRRLGLASDAGGHVDPATAGYPGGWDDDEALDVPQAAAR